MPRVKELAYNRLVQLQLEYAAPVWDPHTRDKTTLIEKVQCWAARWTVSNYDRPLYLKISDRILLSKMSRCITLFYKKRSLWTGCCFCTPLAQYVQLSRHISRYCHSMPYRQLYYYKYSFYPLAISSGMLFLSLVHLPSLEAFKTASIPNYRPQIAYF